METHNNLALENVCVNFHSNEMQTSGDINGYCIFILAYFEKCVDHIMCFPGIDFTWAGHSVILTYLEFFKIY